MKTLDDQIRSARPQWKIYYGDGSTFDSTEGDPEDAPATDIQIIIQFSEDGERDRQSGSDYYVRRDGRWQGVDIFGLFDYLMSESRVKFGRYLSNRAFRRISDHANSDPAMVGRSGPRKKRGKRR
jgi:hypothetical protein